MDFDLDTIASVFDTLSAIVPKGHPFLSIASAGLLGVGLILHAIAKVRKQQQKNVQELKHEIAEVKAPAAPVDFPKP